MVQNNLKEKFADVPLARPGFDALGMSAPVLIQMNADGQWQNTKPGDLEEKNLKSIVQYLVSTNTLSAAQSYCTQCAIQNKKDCGQSKYVPVILMPILPADQCPFDLDCETVKEVKAEDNKKYSKKQTTQENTAIDNSIKKTRSKKRGFVMQRLNDFDLLSQW